MTNRYLLMVETADDTFLLKRGFHKGALLTAVEGNQEHLAAIGDRLLEEGLILGYQLLVTAGAPVYPTESIT